MKINKIEEEYADLRKIQNFHHEKVQFPASKSTPKWSEYPQKLSQCDTKSLEIVLDTHSMLFERLEATLGFHIHSHENQ